MFKTMKLKKLRYIHFVQCALILFITFALNQRTFGQQPESLPVKGKISDLAGNPLPGASILIEGTTAGVITDAAGTFTITCPKDKVLVVSFVGYKTQKFTVATAEPLTITMEEDFNKIDEIV